MKRHDRIYGCLLGGACGDTFGAPVEFLSKDKIILDFGPDGITEFAEYDGIVGAVTDDTQMTLFTVEGLIKAGVRAHNQGICHIPSVVHHAYRRWLMTQESDRADLETADDMDGWLIADGRLWARRAPGATCLSALRSTSAFGTKARNNSKGCGTVMHDAPFGFTGHGPAMAFELAAEAASTTHGHPSAQNASGAIASIIHFIADGKDIRSAVEATLPLLEKDDADEVLHSLQHALKLSDATDWLIRLSELGEGWVAEEALGISVLCALAAETPREAIVAAVNHSGDSDSTGAITGNIVGTMHGPSSFPDTWTAKVELRDTIEILARDFAALLEAGAGPLEPRYPGW